MRESKIEFYFRERFEQAGYLVRKVKWIGRRGAPDRIVMGPGGYSYITFFVELKATGKDLEDHQLREIERMRKHGAHVYVIDSTKGVDDLLREMELIT